MMTAPSGTRYVPKGELQKVKKAKPHWTEAVQTENRKLKQEIAELRMAPNLHRFAREVGDNLMLMLANMPYERWPDLAKSAFKHAQDRQETTAHFYRERLPKL